MLDTVLDTIATYKENIESLKGKIKKALFYPATVIAVAILVSAILLIFVVPQFEQVFESFGADLPAFTKMIIARQRLHDRLLVAGARHRASAHRFAFVFFKKRSLALRALPRPD